MKNQQTNFSFVALCAPLPGTAHYTKMQQVKDFR